MRSFSPTLVAGLAVALLAGCGGGGDDRGAVDAVTRIDQIVTSARGIEDIAFDGGTAYLSLGNSTASASSIMRSVGSVGVASQWTPMAVSSCALPVLGPDDYPRAARLKQAAGKTWLYQPSYGEKDHSLCALDTASSAWVPKDDKLRVCYQGYCDVLWMDQLQAVGTHLFSNAGAGLNLLVSDDVGLTWRALIGSVESYSCTHQAFEIVGSRLIVGGECPLDAAYLRAYQLSADGTHLASPTPLPMSVPDIENRNIQLIQAIAGTERVFAGVEGGLLRSDDGGKTFSFAIRFNQDDKRYPYITRLLSPKGKPNVVVAAGFDKATSKPYLAWSNDGGVKWTELSSMLPRYARSSPTDDLAAQVTSLVEDPSGRIFLTMNDEPETKGRLLLLTLGKP
jgi:hypothetical protein